MAGKISPLAPSHTDDLPPIAGVRLGSVEAGIKYRGRKDLAVIAFDEAASVAGVFTKSKCPSAPVDWCREILPLGRANLVVINSGNANAFTGMKGKAAVDETLNACNSVFGVSREGVFLSSTGVIGEPLDASGFASHLANAKAELAEDGWLDCARTIMTTDTFPKAVSEQFEIDSEIFQINGIVKGSGMIAPDMATMLGYVVTDFPIDSRKLQSCLSECVASSFNAITVDSDTSTSDTVLAFSTTGLDNQKAEKFSPGLETFREKLQIVCHALAMLVVRDGEGASKHIEVGVSGATSDESAKKIAFAIANSPLVKTAIAGCDANWGRIVMAVGKAGEPADRDKLKISFGGLVVAVDGEREPGYSEDAASEIMQASFIPIEVDLGLGNGEAKVWTCDLTKEYVAINGDYRS